MPLEPLSSATVALISSRALRLGNARSGKRSGDAMLRIFFDLTLCVTLQKTAPSSLDGAGSRQRMTRTWLAPHPSPMPSMLGPTESQSAVDRVALSYEDGVTSVPSASSIVFPKPLVEPQSAGR